MMTHSRVSDSALALWLAFAAVATLGLAACGSNRASSSSLSADRSTVPAWTRISYRFVDGSRGERTRSLLVHLWSDGLWICVWGTREDAAYETGHLSAHEVADIYRDVASLRRMWDLRGSAGVPDSNEASFGVVDEKSSWLGEWDEVIWPCWGRTTRHGRPMPEEFGAWIRAKARLLRAIECREMSHEPLPPEIVDRTDCTTVRELASRGLGAPE